MIINKDKKNIKIRILYLILIFTLSFAVVYIAKDKNTETENIPIVEQKEEEKEDKNVITQDDFYQSLEHYIENKYLKEGDFKGAFEYLQNHSLRHDKRVQELIGDIGLVLLLFHEHPPDVQVIIYSLRNPLVSYYITVLLDVRIRNNILYNRESYNLPIYKESAVLEKIEKRDDLRLGHIPGYDYAYVAYFRADASSATFPLTLTIVRKKDGTLFPYSIDYQKEEDKVNIHELPKVKDWERLFNR